MARPLADLNENYVRCRTLGHSWDDWPTSDYVASFGWLLPFRCVRCDTKRLDTIDSRGSVGSRRYIWPDDYKLVEKRSRDEYRRELRFRVYSASEMMESVNGR